MRNPDTHGALWFPRDLWSCGGEIGQGPLGSHIHIHLTFYIENSFLEEIWLALSCGLLHWKYWNRRQEEELFDFDRTHKPICTLDFFLCSVSHLNEYFRCSHSLYLKLQFVFPSP